MLERILRRATKIIAKLKDLSHEERLKECGLTTLEIRRLRGYNIEGFKMLLLFFFLSSSGPVVHKAEVHLVQLGLSADTRLASFQQFHPSTRLSFSTVDYHVLVHS